MSLDDVIGHEPYPWQERLYLRLLAGDVPDEIAMPTGAGKTSCMAIWLLALAHGADLPRRWVHLTWSSDGTESGTTGEHHAAHAQARRLREWARDPNVASALGLSGALALAADGELAGSVDWLDVPAEPSIVIGTHADLGGGLLFGGARPRQLAPWVAGLLATDSLLVLDDAHLHPAMGSLLDQVAAMRSASPVPRPARVLRLSA